MPFLIPFIIGAGGTGYWWYTSGKEEEPTFSSEFFKAIKPVIIAVLVVLFLRWAYAKGTVQNQSK